MVKAEINVPEHLDMQIAQLVEQGEFINREEAVEELLATGLKAYKTSGPVSDTEADRIARRRDREFEDFRKRIKDADQLKVEGAVFDEATLAETEQLLESLNPEARIVRTVEGAVDPGDLLGTGLFDLDTTRRQLFDREGKSEAFDAISRSLANLQRMWAEV